MKRNYNTPEIEVSVFAAEEILADSGIVTVEATYNAVVGADASASVAGTVFAW